MSKTVSGAFWSDPEVRRLTKDEKLLFLYFITAPTSHFSGIYYLPLTTISAECGLSDDERAVAMSTLIAYGHLKFDVDFMVVWIKKMLRHQMGWLLEGRKSPSVTLNVVKQLKKLHKCPLVFEFLEYYRDLDIPYDTVSIPSPIPSQDPPQIPSAPSLSLSLSLSVSLSNILFGLIKERNPNFKDPNINEWALTIDRMMRIDKRKASDIEAVIRWCQKDDFWQNNILSAEKLRKQFDQLSMKMGRMGRAKTHGIESGAERLQQAIEGRQSKSETDGE